MAMVAIDQVVFPHELTPGDLSTALKTIQAARETTNKFVAGLQKRIVSGNKAQQEYAVMLLTSMPDVLLCSALDANKKLKMRKRQTLEQCFCIAETLNFDVPLTEKVAVHVRTKKDGGFRLIHDHRLQHRTGQKAVVRVMSLYFKPRLFQYTHQGVGAAIKQAKKDISDGLLYAARLDIKSFFSSFETDQLLNELPLPEEVVKNVVTGRHMKVVLEKNAGKGSYNPPLGQNTKTNLLHQARQGIPHGSGCSPIVGMFCMSHLFWQAIDGVSLINYVDDFLITAASPALLEKAVETLTVAVGGLPGGQFQLELIEMTNATKGIEFLGHHMRLTNGNLMTEPTDFNQNNFFALLGTLDDKICQTVSSSGSLEANAIMPLLARMYALMMGWCAAFGQCELAAEFRSFASISIKQWLGALGKDVSDLEAWLSPDMFYRPHSYSFEH